MAANGKGRSKGAEDALYEDGEEYDAEDYEEEE